MPVTDTNYNSTLAVTDNVGINQTIAPNGLNQGDVYSLLSTIRTNFNAMNAKLDADAGVNGTDYASLWNISALDVNNVFLNGFNQSALVDFISLVETNFEGVTAKLDLDSGVADTDYAATLNFNKDVDLTTKGMSQQGLVNTLQTIITQINALLTKLDADS